MLDLSGLRAKSLFSVRFYGTFVTNVSPNSLTCRQRKLKCDETKPVCGQCRKASRECQPSEGVVFRHQQNASMSSNGQAGLGSFYAYKNTFDVNNVWVKVPKNGAQLSMGRCRRTY
jgi:hypothetical protein